MSPVPNTIVSLPWHLSFIFSLPSLLTKAHIYIFFFNLTHLTLSVHHPLIFDWQYHPDKQSADVPAGTVEECIRKFIEIDQAWKILGNEETKKEYDLQRHGRYSWCGASTLAPLWSTVHSHSRGAFSSICTNLLLPFLLPLPQIIVFNYALFLVMIVMYPLRNSQNY